MLASRMATVGTRRVISRNCSLVIGQITARSDRQVALARMVFISVRKLSEEVVRAAQGDHALTSEHTCAAEFHVSVE